MAVAQTWHASAQSVAWASAKYVIDVINAAASAKTIKVYRIWIWNNYVAAVTGVINPIQVKRSSAASAGTGITCVPHSIGNTALDANTTAGTGRTVTSTSIFRQILFQCEEPVVTTLTVQSLLTLVPFCEVWNSAYGDNNIQPLTCRAGNAEGICVQQPGANAAGTCDVEMEFTNE